MGIGICDCVFAWFGSGCWERERERATRKEGELLLESGSKSQARLDR